MSNRKSNKKTASKKSNVHPTVLVATIGLVGTIVTALLASPVLSTWIQSVAIKPTVTPTPIQTVVTITVDAQNSTWLDTGIYVEAADEVKIVSSGEIDLGGATSRPAGNPGINPKAHGIVQSVNYGTLVGTIGSGAVFVVGDFYQMSVTDTGNLRLLINDTVNGYVNNSGQYEVVVTITKAK